jgi:outer membrane cobalamin receptor
MKFSKKMNAMRQSILFFTLLSMAVPLSVSANDPNNLEIAKEEKAMLNLFYEMSSLPTRTHQRVDEVPAIMTVITAEQIKQMGARDLKDVLVHIPGMQVGISAVGYPQLTFRGMSSHGSEKIKFMVDGHDVDITLTGGAALLFLNLSVDYIQKVEVLHGPGSALYGSDAILGVINIVTRRELKLDSAAITARLGSYDSQRYNLEYGHTYGALHLWSNMNYYNTNGADVSIAEDGLFGTINEAISNAPGNTNEWTERTDFSFGFELGNWNLQGQYLNHSDGGFYNPGFSLSDETVIGREYFWSDLAWKDNFFDEQFTLQTKFIYNRYDHDYDVMQKPSGFRTGPTTYTNGIRSISEAVVEDFGAEVQSDIYSIENHTITFGAEVKKTRLFDVTHHANYNPSPLAGIVDVSDIFNWSNEADRTYYSFYGQEQWRITETIMATLGGRYDHYDDFGSAFSPSASINWQFHDEWNLIVTYGEAFRAPSFRELYKLPAGSPLRGAPTLDPEKAKSWQAAMEWRPYSDLTLSLNGYWNEFDDTIYTANLPAGAKMFASGSDSKTRGINLTGQLRLPPSMPDITFLGSLTFIDAEDDNGDEQEGVASLLGTAGLDWRFSQFWNLNLSCWYVGKVPLEESDPRDDVDDYLLSDLTLTGEGWLGKMPDLDIGISIHNLFDVHYAFPEHTGRIPDNFERPGITLDVWLKYSF